MSTNSSQGIVQQPEWFFVSLYRVCLICLRKFLTEFPKTKHENLPYNFMSTNSSQGIVQQPECFCVIIQGVSNMLEKILD